MISTEFVNHSAVLGNLLSLTKTPYGICTVREQEKLRWLLIDNTLQSICNIEHPEYMLLPHLTKLAQLWQSLDVPANILEIGLGGGAIRNYLQSTFPATDLMTLEKNSTVIELYEQYFKAAEHGQLVLGDITQIQITERFDWLILDLFSQQECPVFLFQQGFYEKLKALFNEQYDRHFFINFICDNDAQLVKLEAILATVFESQANIYPIHGYNNKIIHLHF